MGLLKAIRKGRAAAKAEAKAAKARVRAEVKHNAKTKLKRDKLMAKMEKTLLKEEKKGLKAKRKHEREMAKNQLAQLEAGRFNKKTVKRYAGAARVALPLLLPLVYRVVTEVRAKNSSSLQAKPAEPRYH